MRKFSDWEKDIIREIAKQSQNKFTFNVFILFMDLFIYKKYFCYENATKCLSYNFNEIKQGDLYKEEQILFDRMFLLNYLAENKYIYVSLHNNADVEFGRYGTKTMEYKDTGLPKPLISEFHKCINSWIYVSKNLFSLVENDFKECEEIALEEAKKQTKEAKVQTIAAIVSAVFAIIAAITAIITVCITVK